MHGLSIGVLALIGIASFYGSQAYFKRRRGQADVEDVERTNVLKARLRKVGWVSLGLFVALEVTAVALRR